MRRQPAPLRRTIERLSSLPSSLGPPFEYVLVVAEQNRGWVLDGICRDLAARLPGSIVWYDDGLKSLPRARRYFFSHVSLFLARARWLRRKTAVAVLYTHPSRPISTTDRMLLNTLRPRVLCMSGHGMAVLHAGGVDTDLLSRAIPGVDQHRFRPHERAGGLVGFCSAYYERKNPSTMLEIVRAAPTERFLLIGRGWDSSPWAEELARLPNLHHVEASYDDYPSLYERMDVFVSPSVLEGGPMPLLEAMMSNVVPIATRTGFAPDLIDHGINGLLTDTASTPTEFIRLVESARHITTDIRSSVEQYTLDAFALQVKRALNSRP